MSEDQPLVAVGRAPSGTILVDCGSPITLPCNVISAECLIRARDESLTEAEGSRPRKDEV